MGAVETGPHAESIPFDNLSNGFTSNRVQPAIEEAKNTAEGKARTVLSCGRNGGATANAWLQFFQGSDSDQAPYTFIDNIIVVGVSINNNTATTVIVNLLKNGSFWFSVSLSSQKSAVHYPVGMTAMPGDQLSLQIASGSGGRLMVYPHFRTV